MQRRSFGTGHAMHTATHLRTRPVPQDLFLPRSAGRRAEPARQSSSRVPSPEQPACWAGGQQGGGSSPPAGLGLRRISSAHGTDTEQGQRQSCTEQRGWGHGKAPSDSTGGLLLQLRLGGCRVLPARGTPAPATFTQILRPHQEPAGLSSRLTPAGLPPVPVLPAPF